MKDLIPEPLKPALRRARDTAKGMRDKRYALRGVVSAVYGGAHDGRTLNLALDARDGSDMLWLIDAQGAALGLGAGYRSEGLQAWTVDVLGTAVAPGDFELRVGPTAESSSPVTLAPTNRVATDVVRDGAPQPTSTSRVSLTFAPGGTTVHVQIDPSPARAIAIKSHNDGTYGLHVANVDDGASVFACSRDSSDRVRIGEVQAGRSTIDVKQMSPPGRGEEVWDVVVGTSDGVIDALTVAPEDLTRADKSISVPGYVEYGDADETVWKPYIAIVGTLAVKCSVETKAALT